MKHRFILKIWFQSADGKSKVGYQERFITLSAKKSQGHFLHDFSDLKSLLSLSKALNEAKNNCINAGFRMGKYYEWVTDSSDNAYFLKYKLI